MSFSGSLETKCVSLINEPGMTRPNLVDLNHIELNNYPFMVSLDGCSGSCNAVDDLSTNACVTSKTKDINYKAFHMITRRNEAKTLAKHISCDCKCKFNTATCNSTQKWNNDKCHCECKKYRACKKDYSWNPRCLKSVVETSVIVRDEVMNVPASLSTIVTNTISTNVTSTLSINFDDKKVRYKMNCYILHTFFLVIILLFIIDIICYHYTE